MLKTIEIPSISIYDPVSYEGQKFSTLIQYVIASFIQKDNTNFYISFLNSFNYKFLKNGKDYPHFDVGTRVQNDIVSFLINPGVFFRKNETEMIFRLIHECEHVLQQHILFDPKENKGFDHMITVERKYKDIDGEYKSYMENTPLCNLAMDLDVNSLRFRINSNNDYTNVYEGEDFLLQEGIFPSIKEFTKFKPHQNWESYYEQLIEKAKNNEGGFSMNGKLIGIPDSLAKKFFGYTDFIDSNGNKTSPSSVNRDFLESNLNSLIETSAKHAGEKTPFRYKSYLDNLKRVKFNWRETISQFIRRGFVPLKKNSKRKLNRRGISKGAILQGTVETFDTNVVFAIDTSGSMSQEDFEKAVNHLNKIRLTTKATVHAMCFDTDVHLFEELTDKNYKRILKTKVAESFSRGGTKFFPIFNYLKDHKINTDVFIVFTDGYNYEGTFENPLKRIPTLWVYTKDHMKHIFGKHIIME